MKQTKKFKNKNFKLVVYICLLVLVFNFSLARAEETTVSQDTSPAADSAAAVSAGESAPSGETNTTIDPLTSSGQGASASEPVPSAGPEQATTVEPAAPTQSTPENPVEPAPQDSNLPTPLNPPLSGGQGAEDLTPLSSTTSEPIIFDFNQPTETTTPETVVNDPVNNVAGASESSDNGSPILHEVITGIIRDANIKGLTILAQWQMSNEKADGKYLGTDNSTLTGAQFLPSGQFEISKPVAVCALVADAGGADDINNVSAIINYPEAVVKTISSAGEPSGCGQLKSQFNLAKLDPVDAAALVCDKLRNNNNNLLAWGSDKIDNLVYSYEHLCGQDGLLIKQAAELYCAETPLAYDDPAGDYLIKISAKNNSGVDSASSPQAEVTGENYLKYLELTTFANDFSEILYGPVKLNEAKILKGDLAWGESTDPTVRNTGNTRLQINIWQNDFGLGKTGDDWNLAYQAKVGTSTDFISYSPEQTTALNGILELGQTASMDFAVLIKKFPEANSDSAFWGKMTLSADKVEPLSCQ